MNQNYNQPPLPSLLHLGLCLCRNIYKNNHRTDLVTVLIYEWIAYQTYLEWGRPVQVLNKILINVHNFMLTGFMIPWWHITISNKYKPCTYYMDCTACHIEGYASPVHQILLFNIPSLASWKVSFLRGMSHHHEIYHLRILVTRNSQLTHICVRKQS